MFFFKSVLDILGPLNFYINSEISLSVFAKKLDEILLGIVLNQFGKYCCEHGIFHIYLVIFNSVSTVFCNLQSTNILFLLKFIPKYLIIFYAIINGIIFFLNPLLDYLIQVLYFSFKYNSDKHSYFQSTNSVLGWMSNKEYKTWFLNSKNIQSS